MKLISMTWNDLYYHINDTYLAIVLVSIEILAKAKEIENGWLTNKLN